MGKNILRDAPVFTHDSVITTKDAKKQQAIIDEWTDELAAKMAEKAECIVLDDGNVQFRRKTRQGGHNRQTIEILNDEGYVVRIFHSIAETAMYFGVNTEVITRTLDGKRKSPLAPGVTIRRRETEAERRKREKTAAKANKQRQKTINKKKRNYGKRKERKEAKD